MSHGLTFTLDRSESEAVRVWMTAHPQKIALLQPDRLFTAEGLVETVEVADRDRGVSITVVLKEAASADAQARARVVETMTAFLDDAKRLLRYVPDYGDVHSNRSAFKHSEDNRPSTPLLTVPGRILYSHPDFVILYCDANGDMSVWCENGGKPEGLLWFDKRMSGNLMKAISKDSTSERFLSLGLGGRAIAEMEESVLHIADIPALIDRQVRENNKLLDSHTLKNHVRPEHRLAYVDEDLILAVVRGPGGGVYLCYRREGLAENREYFGPEGKRLAARATKAMADGAKPGNPFRRWVEKKDYEFDTGPHNPRN